MVTSSVWMLNWVHRNTSNLWPSLSLWLVSVVEGGGSHYWLLVSSTSGDDSDHSSGLTSNSLLDARWKLNSDFSSVFVGTNDGGESSGSSGELTTVSLVLLNVGDDGTFWDLVNRQDVSDGDSGLGSAVDVLSRVHTFSSEEVFSFNLEFMWISELNLGEWSTSAWVVDDVSDDTFNVS